jgi:hypothetical protein
VTAHMLCIHCNVPIIATGDERAFIHVVTGLPYCGSAVEREYQQEFRTQARPNLSLLTRQTFYELTPANERHYESTY